MVEQDKSPSEENICDVRVIHFDRVRQALQSAVEPVKLNRLSRLFKTLGDPTRLKIVLALRNQEMCVCDIAAFLNVSESAVSHQLRHLRAESLVRTRRAGQIVYYSLDDHHVTDLLEIGMVHGDE